MTSKGIPILPNELWQRIFFFASQNTDTPCDHIKLWTSVRAVSRSWRANITREYLEAYIKDPARCLIYWDAGEAYVPNMEHGSIHQFGLEMTFDRFDEDAGGNEDKSRVVFKETKQTRLIPEYWSAKMKSAHKRKKMRGWKEKIETYLGTGYLGDEAGGGCFDDTAHVICIYGQVNDTALPGLRFDLKKFEISFEWEPMLVAFMKEALEVNRRTDEVRVKFQDGILKATSKISPKKFLASMTAVTDTMDKAKKQVRRERIWRHYRAINDFWAENDFPYDDEEEAVILERISGFVGAGGDEQQSRILKALGGGESEDEWVDVDEDQENSNDEDEDHDENEEEAEASEHESDGMVDVYDVDTGEEGDSTDSDDDGHDI